MEHIKFENQGEGEGSAVEGRSALKRGPEQTSLCRDGYSVGHKMS